MFASKKCTWYFNSGVKTVYTNDEEFQWNIYPLYDLIDNYNGIFGWMPIIEINGPIEEWDLKPNFQPDNDIFEEDERKTVKFDYLTAEAHGNREGAMSPNSMISIGRTSCASEDLFASGKDDIVFEGELMKFKPGISANFVKRYVQVS